MAETPDTTSRAVAEAIPWQELENLVSGECLRQGVPSDGLFGVVPARVASPSNEQEISSILAWANQHGICIAVAGGGTKQDLGGPPHTIDLLLRTEKLNCLIEHAHEDMTATVQSGVTVAWLQAELARNRQRLAVDVLWPDRATMGGIIATNDSGALRLRFGSIRDLLIGATVVLADGTIARSGGKVVKNVAGYDLPKLLTGSMGTLGVITQATFRVHPLPHASETLSFRFSDDAAANDFILAVNDSTLVPASVQVRRSSGQAAEVDLLFEGLEAGIAAQRTMVLRMASAGHRLEAQPTAWQARQNLWNREGCNFVCKISVLPSKIASLVADLRSRFDNFESVVQATGLGQFAANSTADNILALRKRVQEEGGSLVVLRCPEDVRLDRFGLSEDVAAMMARVKQRFDRNGILNRDRFSGGV